MRKIGSYHWIRVNGGGWQIGQLAHIDKHGEHFEIIGSSDYFGASEVGSEIKKP